MCMHLGFLHLKLIGFTFVVKESHHSMHQWEKCSKSKGTGPASAAVLKAEIKSQVSTVSETV